MQDFIQSVTSRFGISEGQAQSATAAALNFLKEQGGQDADNLIAKIPGASSVMQSSTTGQGGGGGLLGGLGGLAGKLGGAGGALAALQASGLDMGQAKSFASMLIDYAKQKAGAEQVEQVLSKVPALKNLTQ